MAAATKRLTKSQEELDQLNTTLRQVGEYNTEVQAKIAVARRSTYKAEDQIKEIEKVKHKQDILIDNMNQDIKRMTEQKALLDAQLVAQKQESEAAMATLREAGKQMESIEFEKKQLMQQWRSSLVGMTRRDEALQNVQQALTEQSEQELAVENEIRGLTQCTKKEQERNEQLCSLRDRNDKEMQHLHGSMTSIRQDRERLMDQFGLLKKSMDGHVEETTRLKASIQDTHHSMEVVERNVQTVSREITGLISKMEDETSEQTTCDRVAANSQKRIRKIMQETQQLEVETQNLHNEIARVTVDGLNTRAHNQMLKDRHKELCDDLIEREKLIEQYEQEIRKRHHQVEKKQLYVDRLNKEFDDKRLKLEAEAGEADVAGPQEAKLKHLNKNINDLKKECSDMQKDWIQKQTQLLAISTDTDRLRNHLNDQKNRKMVLEQKKIRIEGQLESQQKEIKEMKNAMKHLRLDMDRMSGALHNKDDKSKELADDNQMMETEFVVKLKEIENSCLEMEGAVEKVKEEKSDMTQEVLESERQVLLWERKIMLEKQMQEALDPSVGQVEAAAMKKEIHRMELRLDQLKRRQEHMIIEMERTISKRDAIAQKYEPKAKKTKQVSTAANLKRQIQSLRNNLRLCTQATADAEQQLGERESAQQGLQQTISTSNQEYGAMETDAEKLRSEVQVLTVAKQRNLAALLKQQRAARRYDELAMGTGPPPAGNSRAQYTDQLAQKNKVIDIVRLLHDAYPQLESLWTEFYTWLEVPPG